MRTRPLALILYALYPIVGIIISTASLTTPEAGSVFFSVLSLLWTCGTVAMFVGELLFVVTITPTGLEWTYFRQHNLDFNQMREMRIVGDKPGGRTLVIRGHRRRDTVRIDTIKLSRGDIQAIVDAVAVGAPHVVIRDDTNRLLRRYNR